MVMIRKMTMPTTRLPATTKLPNVSMMAPASACSSTRRVVEIDNANRNNVLSSRTAGNAKNSPAEEM